MAKPIPTPEFSMVETVVVKVVEPSITVIIPEGVKVRKVAAATLEDQKKAEVAFYVKHPEKRPPRYSPKRRAELTALLRDMREVLGK